MSNDPAKPEDNNVVALRAVFDSPDKRIAGRRTEKPDDQGGGGDTPPTYEKRGLDNPPFAALGSTEDGAYVFSDARGIIRIVKEKDIARRFMLSLCAPYTDWLRDNFSRMSEDGKRGRVDFNEAEEFAFNLCSSKGFFDLRKSIRGRGAWRGREGALVYHCGDRVIVNGVSHAPGEIDGSFYPAKAPSPAPYSVDVGADELIGLFEKLKRWNWKQETGALLLFGWIAVAFIGGWLPFRPAIFITGARGTGKTTLIRFIADLFKDMMVVTADTTQMGMAQKLGQDSIPAFVDELEAGGDERRAQEILKLFRLSTTGSDRLRGSADHSGAKESIARSSMGAAAINVPPLEPQDRSRFAILELLEIKVAGSGIGWDLVEIAETQRKIMRRLQDQIVHWEGTAAVFRRALIARGHDDRNADVFATLLTGAHTLRCDGVVSEEVAIALAEKFELAALSEAEDDVRNEDLCRDHLLTHSIPLDGSAPRRPAAEWIKMAVSQALSSDQDEAHRVLARYGLRIDWKGDIASSNFLVANTHSELSKIFAGTPWASRAGATGGHRQALRKLPGAESGSQTFYFAGAKARATVLPLASVMADDDRKSSHVPADVQPELPRSN